MPNDKEELIHDHFQITPNAYVPLVDTHICTGRLINQKYYMIIQSTSIHTLHVPTIDARELLCDFDAQRVRGSNLREN